jgi:hypothetical protein
MLTDPLQFPTIKSLAEWKMREDLRLTVTSRHSRWVESWVKKLRVLVLAMGRNPYEVTVTKNALAASLRQEARPPKKENLQARFRELFDDAEKGKLRVCCEGTQLGAFAVLTSMVEEHSLKIQIVANSPTGKALTRSLDVDYGGDFDFVAMTLAPAVLEASSEFARKYRILRVLHKEGHQLLQKRRKRPKEPFGRLHPLYVMKNSSSHASVCGTPHHLIPLDDVGELIAYAANPVDENAQFVIWEPLAKWLLSRPHFRLEPASPKGYHPIVLLCSRRYDQDEHRRVGNQFNEMFWLQWTRLRRKPATAFSYISPSNTPRGFCTQFGAEFRRRNFSDYWEYPWIKPVTSRLSPKSWEVLKLLVKVEQRWTITAVHDASKNDSKLPRGKMQIADCFNELLEHNPPLASRNPHHPKGGIIPTPEGTQLVADANQARSPG